MTALLSLLAAKAAPYIIGAGAILTAFAGAYLKGRSAGKRTAETAQKAKEAEARANEIDRIKRAAGATPVGMQHDQNNRDNRPA
jgi:hypothetical protein